MGVALLWALAAGVSAAPPGAVPPPDNPAAIVVTGERVRRSLKDTSSSVALFDKDGIARLAGADRLQQLLEFTPNVLAGSSRDTPVIRGQDSIGVLQGLPGFLGGARPRTTVQVDGRAVGYNEFAFSIFGLWDVDRVEVFRTPQTTTQGPNAIGGAIFIETADPGYEAEAKARGVIGQAHTREIAAAVSGPLVDEQLALRLSGDLRLSLTASRLHGPIGGVTRHDDRYGTFRAKLLAQPAAIPGLRLLLTYAHSQSAAPQIEGVDQPVRRRRDDNVRYGYFKIDEDSLSARASYAISPTLQSRTTLTWGDGRIQRFAVRGFGESKIRGRDHSLESVLQWKPEGPVSLVGGVHLLSQDLDQRIDLTTALLGIGTFDDRQRGQGVFGEVEVHPAAAVTVTGGLRYQRDSKVRKGALAGGVADTPLDFRKRWHVLLPKLSVAYDLDSDVRVGAMVLRAYNPGGVSLDLISRRPLEFEPERLWDYEAFVRTGHPGGALHVTANLFYNDIRDAQRELDIPLDSPEGPVGLIAISNAPKARTYGAEIEISYALSERLSVQGAAGLLRTRLTRTLSTHDPILGKQFARAPHFTGAVGIDWEPLRNFRLSSQLRHRSGYFGDDPNTPRLRVSGDTTVDAKASWKRGRLSFFAYAQNLLDRFTIIAWGDERRVDGVANDPREVGVGVEAGF